MEQCWLTAFYTICCLNVVPYDLIIRRRIQDIRQTDQIVIGINTVASRRCARIDWNFKLFETRILPKRLGSITHVASFRNIFIKRYRIVSFHLVLSKITKIQKYLA